MQKIKSADQLRILISPFVFLCLNSKIAIVSISEYLTFSNIIFFRLSLYQQFKDFHKRILVATNLFGRGMDIERVNIVINYDMPEDSDMYLHRVRVEILQIR